MVSPAPIEALVQRGESMNVIRHDPLREAMQLLRHQLFHQHSEHRDDELQGAAGSWMPLVDIYEDGEGITLKVELPEVEAGDVDIQVEGNSLTLRGERRLENAGNQEGYQRVERSYGNFARRFTLPSTVEMANATAQSRDGVLRIFLPKKAETKPRQIKVQTDPMIGPQVPQKQ
jgi:HSP20 family protein